MGSRAKSKREREEACYICGHYHDFDGGEPCGTCGHVLTHTEKKANEGVLPTAIVPGFLYLGSYDTASRSELLKAMAITHILNTVPNCQALFKNTFRYHTVESSPPDFDECFSFIETVSQGENTKLLVYCMSGASRSPTVVIGYLMKVRGWRLAESYKWVKDKRPMININKDDTARLQALEVHLHGSCSVPHGFTALSLMPGNFFNPGLPSTSTQPSTSAPTFAGAAPAGCAAAAAANGSSMPFGGDGQSASAGAAGGPGRPAGGPISFVFGAVGGGQQQQQLGPPARSADTEMEL